MAFLTEFLLRLSFGLAFALGLTSSRHVPAGFFRIQHYILLGVNVLAGLAACSLGNKQRMWLAAATAVISYVGSVVWLYEKTRPGKVLVWLSAALSLAGCWSSATLASSTGEMPSAAAWVDGPTSGLLLGSTLTAMLLGHWYLNTPTMQLAPLRQLLLLLAFSIVLRAIVTGALDASADFDLATWAAEPLVLLRWLGGIVGVLVVTLMAWMTLNIPNTQSATGLLYVAVIGVLLGELTDQLLSVSRAGPL